MNSVITPTLSSVDASSIIITSFGAVVCEAMLFNDSDRKLAWLKFGTTIAIEGLRAVKGWPSIFLPTSSFIMARPTTGQVSRQ